MLESSGVHIRDSPDYGHVKSVKQDILKVADYIRQNRLRVPTISACLEAQLKKRQASLESVLTIKTKLDESKILVRIQRELMIKGVSGQMMSPLTEKGSQEEITNLIIRPEHFSRQSQAQAKAKAFPSQKSPWEGTNYKLALVLSLNEKFSLKYIFVSIKHMVLISKMIDSAVVLSLDIKMKRLARLCFSSIVLEALSSRYIEMNCNAVVRKHLIRPLFRHWVIETQFQTACKIRQPSLDLHHRCAG